MNLLGLPAAVVPVGAAAGLPQVVQIIGPDHADWSRVACRAVEGATARCHFVSAEQHPKGD
jgi:Asp-tRNA(Asn)/Glu-tRNA(Gln) amidotransferase A subunit family amidase